MAQRIQRTRKKGYKSPVGSVYVGRPTKWGNPFKSDNTISPTGVVRMYETWLRFSDEAKPLRESLGELRGKDLSCWCRFDSPCHADVLIELANRGE